MLALVGLATVIILLVVIASRLMSPRVARQRTVTQPDRLLSIGGVVRARVFLFGMILSSAVAARAQMPAPVVSPEVSADRTITLRYRAPDAKQITVTGELDGKPHPVTKGSDGVWTVAIG